MQQIWEHQSFFMCVHIHTKKGICLEWASVQREIDLGPDCRIWLDLCDGERWNLSALKWALEGSSYFGVLFFDRINGTCQWTLFDEEMCFVKRTDPPINYQSFILMQANPVFPTAITSCNSGQMRLEVNFKRINLPLLVLCLTETGLKYQEYWCCRPSTLLNHY